MKYYSVAELGAGVREERYRPGRALRWPLSGAHFKD